MKFRGKRLLLLSAFIGIHFFDFRSTLTDESSLSIIGSINTAWKVYILGVFLIRMRENKEQKNSEYVHFSRCVLYSIIDIRQGPVKSW